MNKWLVCVASLAWIAGCAGSVKVMRQGLGPGSIVSNPAGLNCSDACQSSFPKNRTISLTAMPASGSTFVGWDGDCSGSTPNCSVFTDRARAVRARFDVSGLPTLATTALSGEVIRDFLAANPSINSPGRFIAAIGDLPDPYRFKDNWILMIRSESLQTGHAASPRVILPSKDSKNIFSFALTADAAFPHADPNKIEYIQYEDATQRFRFHEIDVAANTVTLDARACAECHATRPNWDAYDSWAGMVPFNRDRVYKGSVDAAALRALFNPWGKSGAMREILEQLNLPNATMSRIAGGAFDGAVQFPTLDDSSVILAEPAIAGLPSTTNRSIAYPAGPPASNIAQGGPFFHIFNSAVGNTTNVDPDAEGRGVDLFDQLTLINAERIARELLNHPRSPVDVRPMALAIATSCSVETWLSPAQRAFFTTRHRGADLNAIASDTESRRRALPQLKVDLERDALTAANGLLAAYGAVTQLGATVNDRRWRQEVFRRPLANRTPDQVTREFVDRETIEREVAAFRYFLEPLGVPVSKWSLSVGGRSRTYTFADLFPVVQPIIAATVATDLGLAAPLSCATLRPLVESSLATLPPAAATPAYAEVQKIFDRHCLQCHGSFNVRGGPYPPNLVPGLSHSQLLRPPAPMTARVIARDLANSRLYQRLIAPAARMPPEADGPALSSAEVNVIERWILGGALDAATSVPPAPPTCQQQCRSARDACMDEVGDPGGPRPQQCASEYQACVRQCTTRGCNANQRCCEPGIGDEGCRMCRPRAQACP